MAKRKLSKWQKHVKSFMRKYPGLSFKEALPKAKLTYKKGTSPRRSPPRRSNPKRGGKMAKKKTRRRSQSLTIPIAAVGGALVGVAGPAIEFGADALAGNANSQRELVYHIIHNYTGWSMWNNRFEPEGLMKGLVPAIIGGLVHKYVGGAPININKVLARNNIPFIRI